MWNGDNRWNVPVQMRLSWLPSEWDWVRRDTFNSWPGSTLLLRHRNVQPAVLLLANIKLSSDQVLTFSSLNWSLFSNWPEVNTIVSTGIGTIRCQFSMQYFVFTLGQMVTLQYTSLVRGGSQDIVTLWWLYALHSTFYIIIQAVRQFCQHKGLES